MSGYKIMGEDGIIASGFETENEAHDWLCRYDAGEGIFHIIEDLRDEWSLDKIIFSMGLDLINSTKGEKN